MLKQNALQLLSVILIHFLLNQFLLGGKPKFKAICRKIQNKVFILNSIFDTTMHNVNEKIF